MKTLKFDNIKLLITTTLIILSGQYKQNSVQKLFVHIVKAFQPNKCGFQPTMAE